MVFLKQISLVLMGLMLFTCSGPGKKKLRIAASANTQYAVKELAKSFEAEYGIPCEIILGSSGKLSAQIKAGAPYHIFISADMKNPEYLHTHGLSDNQPEVYALGQLVLWSLVLEKDSIFTRFKQRKIRRLASANPATAPYGMAAREALKNLRLSEVYKDRLVFGESIAQTNSFIFSKAVEAGFTAKSIVMAPQNVDKGKWISIPDSLHNPIAQGIIVLNTDSSYQAEARAFYTFIFSDKGKEILADFGYFTP